MSAPEIIDFFNEDSQQPSMLDKDFTFSQEQEKSQNKSQNKMRNFNLDDNNIDDKVVWVTAIFVFFGIMVFLLGFWLGKTSIKNMIEKEKQTLAMEEKKLEEKKVENIIIKTDSNTQDTPIIIESLKPQQEEIKKPLENTSTVETKIPEIKTTKPITEKETHENKVVVVPEKKPVIKTQLEKKESKPAPKASSTEGLFSIQVSAHTSMEKARSVEDSLRNMGFYSYLVEASVNGTTYYRVRVGKFSTREEAETALKKIKSSPYGKDSFIINLK